jgi:hypothetical protein
MKSLLKFWVPVFVVKANQGEKEIVVAVKTGKVTGDGKCYS